MRKRVAAWLLIAAGFTTGCASTAESALAVSPLSSIESQPADPASDLTAAEAAVALLKARDARHTKEPDEAILGASAALYLISAGYDTEGHARELLRRLEELATPVGTGVGWGLSEPWDAFNDGSENPRETVYSYTTARASWLFVEASQTLGEDRYLDVAESGVTSLKEKMCCWSDGASSALWYSDQVADQGDDRITPNVSALGIYVLKATGDEALSNSLLEFILDSKGQGYSRELKQGISVGDHNWVYSSGDSTPNDLVHLALIAEGLLASGDPEAREVSLAAIDEAWAAHFSAGGVPRDTLFTRGSHGWGPPAMLWVLSGIPERRSQAVLLAQALLIEYSLSDGSPTGTARGDLWWALAFARAADAGVA